MAVVIFSELLSHKNLAKSIWSLLGIKSKSLKEIHEERKEKAASVIYLINYFEIPHISS